MDRYDDDCRSTKQELNQIKTQRMEAERQPDFLKDTEPMEPVGIPAFTHFRCYQLMNCLIPKYMGQSTLLYLLVAQ